jgi:exosortase H (IPTLxxWG-CTERM-specific)
VNLTSLRQIWGRPEARFLIVFLTILGSSFTVIALNQVNDAIVLPYTAFVARVSAAVLRILGEPAAVTGCIVSSPRFAVTIYNGCNGLITSLIFIAGVLAFPARWTAKLIGVVGGLVVIQILNLIRILSLFYIGIYFPDYFNDAHIFIWQSLIIIAGVALWVVWAHRFALGAETAQ